MGAGVYGQMCVDHATGAVADITNGQAATPETAEAVKNAIKQHPQEFLDPATGNYGVGLIRNPNGPPRVEGMGFDKDACPKPMM